MVENCFRQALDNKSARCEVEEEDERGEKQAESSI
jgi:hypothetical protein